MFQHLKLKNFTVIKEATFLNLGTINVICGINNSGKSTVLQGIDSDRRIVGKSLKNDDLKVLSQLPIIFYPRNASANEVRDDKLDKFSKVENFKDKYFKVLKKLISKKEIWFYDDSAAFQNELEQTSVSLLRKNIFDKVDVRSGQALQGELENHDKTVMIPPKRNIESHSHYAGYKKKNIQSDGDGLLSHLYWLKNQAKNSPEYKLYDGINDAFQEVSTGHTFNITRDAKDELFLRFASKEQDEIEADNCGLGLQDLIVILYFALIPENEIVLIEEPENHIHPAMQRKLLKFLKEKTDKQYFITTHSNVFLNSTYADRIFFTEFEKGEIRVSDVTSRANALHRLGYSITDNLVSDLIVLVEGSGDKDFLEEFFSKYDLDAKYNIKIWILGGDEMVNQDLSAFRQDHEIMALIDKDPQSAKARTSFQRKCTQHNIYCHKLKKYSIESYFSVNALNENFNKYRNNLSEINGLDDAGLRRLIKNDPMWNKLGANDHRRKELKKRIKGKVRGIAKLMTLEEIEGTDLKDFFDKVEETLQDL